jgi:iron complex transport system substrate-binding protein
MTAFQFIFVAALLGAVGCRERVQPVPPVSSGPRLVSLAPNLTEMIWAVGAGSNLIGRTSACDIPAETLDVPSVGGYGDPSFEMLLALQPTAVLYVDMLNKDFPGRLEERGLHVRHIPCIHLDDIPAALVTVGELANRRDQAKALADRLRDEIAAARAGVSNAPRPRVFVVLWADPLYTVGQGSFVSELVALAGGLNIGDAVNNPYFMASPEWVIEQNPEVILCLFEGDASQARARITAIPAFASLSAVRQNRVYAGFDLNLLLRPGPRVMKSVAELRRCLTESQHPEKP